MRKSTCALLLCAMFTLPVIAAEPLTVTHFAGPNEGPGLTDGTGTGARFHSPAGVVSDSAGNLYVADTNLNVIRKIAPNGVVSTVAGLAASPSGTSDGRGGAARLSSPQDVTIDPNGNLYVLEASRIRKISPQGVVTTLAIDLSNPMSFAVDHSGNVVFADINKKLKKITPSGTITQFGTHTEWFNGLAFDANDALTGVDQLGTVYKISSGGVLTSFANVPFGRGMEFDAAGNLYVANGSDSQIKKITTGGVVSTFAGSGWQGNDDGPALNATFLYPEDVAVAPNGDVYVADLHNHSIRKISAAVVTTVAGANRQCTTLNGDLTTARFMYPVDIVADTSGNLYVADNLSIRKITPAGAVTVLAGTSFGSADGTGTNARFGEIAALAIDASNVIYIADYGNHTVRKMTTAGVVSTLAGGAGLIGSTDDTGTAARFNGPQDLAVDASNNVYVADWANHTVRKITPAGVVTTLAGSAGQAGSTDATGSAARFNLPGGLAIVGTDLYVTDYFNQTIRKVTTPGGDVTTVAGLAGTYGTADGIGTGARFYAPSEIEYWNGLLYVSEANFGLRAVTTSGEVTTVLGKLPLGGNCEGTGSNALIHSRGLGVSGNALYMVQREECNVRRVRVPGIPDIATVSTSAPAINTAVLLSTDVNNSTSWQWSLLRRPAGSTAQLSATTTREPNFTPDVADLYTFMLRAEGAAGVRYSTVDILATDTCPPLGSVVASVAGSTNVCETATGGTATATVSGGGAVTYQWGWRSTLNGATTPISGETSSAYVIDGADFGGTGARYLVATVTSSCGVPLTSNPIAVNVNASPSSAITASSGVYANDTHNFASVADAGAGATYAWFITNGTITGGAGTRAIQYTAGATGNVVLDVTVSQNGCASGEEVTIPIIPRESGASMLYLVTPCRLVDSRDTTPLANSATRIVTVAGVCGIPTGATA
ncbi:MAG TPA: hypothetical protein VF608_05405, partial [Thermoanaerobaculia bacterium]